MTLREEVSQRIVFADSVAAGRLAYEVSARCAAAREIAAAGVDRSGVAAVTARSEQRVSIGRKPAVDPASVGVRQADATEAVAKASIYTARLTIDVTPALRGRIKVMAFGRGVTAAEMLRSLLEREFGEDVT